MPSHRLRRLFYRKVMGFETSRSSSIFMHCTFDCKNGLSIGDNSVINPRCRLDTRGTITIGRNVAISQDVIILTGDHDINSTDFKGRNREVVINDYVFIGTRAMILPGVVIGKGAVIAAGSLVTKSVPPFTVVGGVPAITLRTRREDIDYPTYYRRLFQ